MPAMEQIVDMVVIGCMALICALSFQEDAPVMGVSSPSGFQSKSEVPMGRIIGLSATSFAVLPSDIAQSLSGSFLQADYE